MRSLIIFVPLQLTQKANGQKNLIGLRLLPNTCNALKHNLRAFLANVENTRHKCVQIFEINKTEMLLVESAWYWNTDDIIVIICCKSEGLKELQNFSCKFVLFQAKDNRHTPSCFPPWEEVLHQNFLLLHLIDGNVYWQRLFSDCTSHLFGQMRAIFWVIPKYIFALSSSIAEIFFLTHQTSIKRGVSPSM